MSTTTRVRLVDKYYFGATKLQYSLQQDPRDFLITEVALRAIHRGEVEAVLDSLYEHLLPEFVRWGKGRFQAQASYLVDVFQEVLIAFYLRVSRQPDKPIQTPKLKNFLFGIAAKKLATLYQQQQRRLWLENAFHRAIATDPDVAAFSWEGHEALAFDAEVLQDVVATLSPRCADILTRTLLENQKIRHVMMEMGYKDENSTSVTKSRCLTELKKKLSDRFGLEAIAAWFENVTF